MATFGPKYQTEDQAIGRTYVSNAPVPPGTLGAPLEARLNELCQQVANAGMELAVARQEFDRVRQRRDECERTFATLTDQLLHAIQAYREGVPENMPYPR